MAFVFKKLSRKHNGCSRGAVLQSQNGVSLTPASSSSSFSCQAQSNGFVNAEKRDGCVDYRDLGDCLSQPTKQLSRRPHLTRTLEEVLRDPSVLVYFIQFMEVQEALDLLKFWLASESFEASARRLTAFSTSSFSANALSSGADAEGCSFGDRESVSSDTTSNNRSCDNSCRYSSAIHDQADSFERSCRCQSAGDSGISEERLGSASALKQLTEKDAYDLFAKYIEMESPHFVGVTDTIRDTIHNSICDASGDLNPECFTPAREFVFNVMNKRYFPKFMNSVYYYKHQINVLTHESVKLSDILYNLTIRDSFIEFLDRVGHLQYLEFIIAAESFRQDLTSRSCAYDPQEAQSNAMVLYDRYFSMQAAQALAIGNTARIELENNICRDEGPLADCFEQPVRIVWNFLEQECLGRFLSSEQFKTCLEGLKTAVANHVELPSRTGVRRHVTCGSDPGSDLSTASTQSCPPGLCGRKSVPLNNSKAKALQHRVHNLSTEDINTSVRILNVCSTPAKKDKGLSFGRMNDFGVYVSEFEASDPVSTWKKESPLDRIKKTLNEPKKIKEDSAMQAAQSIIEDIQRMTLGDSGEDLTFE